MNIGILLYFAQFYCIVVSGQVPIFKDKVNLALTTTEAAIQEIALRWQINKFPNFLKSCSMSQRSYDTMKTKFKQKILSTEYAVQKNPTKFTICFTGSSVTAGTHHTLLLFTSSSLPITSYRSRLSIQ